MTNPQHPIQYSRLLRSWRGTLKTTTFILYEDILMSITNNKTTPHRFDVVGSFLRPAALKEARLEYEKNNISKSQLTDVEDVCIRELVQKQKDAGLAVITDGEFRRATWHLDFMWGFEGVGHSRTKNGLPFHGEAALLDDTYLTGKISLDKHPFIEHFKFVKSLEDENTVAKLTIPAPAQFLEQMIMPFDQDNTTKYYSDNEELIQDIALGYRTFIRQAYDAGCRNLQFDDCSWGMCVDPNANTIFQTNDAGLDTIMENLLLVNNLAIENKPKDLTVTTHVCRGNFHSTYASSGSYDRVASFLFTRENVSAYFLEFDDARSGGFEPLKYVTGNKKVVLGLITTKSPKLEDKTNIIERIKEAAKIIPLERLCLSPQCGFASCEIGNKLTESQQWEKIGLVKEIAEEIWK